MLLRSFSSFLVRKVSISLRIFYCGYFSFTQKISEDVGSGSRQAKFCLRAELIPSYIPVRVAERILFVGESVQMFESEKQGTKHHYKG